MKPSWASTLLMASFSVGLALASPGLCPAGDWPGWRGPTGVGFTEETDLPLTWGGKANENVLWKVKFGGRSYSSPVVWKDHVFVTTSNKQNDAEIRQKAVPEHHVLCYQVADGKLLWNTVVPAGPYRTDNYAVPTPVTDGRMVYAWFGSAVLAALDADGKLAWRKEWTGPFNLNPALSSSPILYGNTVFLLCEHQGETDSFLLALNKRTGEVKWQRRGPRAGLNNTTPIVIKVKGQPQLVVSSAKTLNGFDPASGEPLWWCASSGFVSSPAYGTGLLYVDNGAEGPGIAVDPTGQGDVTKTHVKWRVPQVPWGYASPIIVGDGVYRVNKPGLLRSWNLATGKPVYSERLEGISSLASPIATANGRIYFASAGKSYVIQAGPQMKVLATNILPGNDDGPSPAFSGGRIFLKSSTELFCIGKK